MRLIERRCNVTLPFKISQGFYSNISIHVTRVNGMLRTQQGLIALIPESSVPGLTLSILRVHHVPIHTY